MRLGKRTGRVLSYLYIHCDGFHPDFPFIFHNTEFLAPFFSESFIQLAPRARGYKRGFCQLARHKGYIKSKKKSLSNGALAPDEIDLPIPRYFLKISREYGLSAIFSSQGRDGMNAI